ncbi:MAG: hypothetical protein US60_C0006G0029 [Microgenomates group bacterium GW2011_GWC1_37_8]|uniref:Uncharacterized protein n=2 Tax=Candidatus Woeseibacteriota TaxID=1752722 RepID=A0A0G0L2A5_9BACT|nr:MAG: hypothetical protein US60_C0006G0029 [Microgenomates group bacterium GW2011_GWC1_37_8]KKQ85102.1 MAG: hypothetical protein UT08_C0010G0029 [Candidatus Woesebacteria bacterium GW2011_GWB1_38_8]OGM20428.1 MAG: hypothetical protein A2863_04825 [Candidatus Woesebacteria bacterium RIFCSPHIGHO2_01_FULL_38_9b]
MTSRKILVAFLIILVAVGGFVAGLFLLRERQDLREEAAVPTGQAKVSIKPESGSFNVGDDVPMQIYFNPANIPISGVAVRLTYGFSGSSPEVSVSAINVNATMLSTGDWTCPTQESRQEGSDVVIEIACANTSSAGFVANSDTLLADVTLKVNKAPSVSPFLVRFDPAESVITRKSDNSDILLIPTSTGSYSIAGSGVQVSPTVTPRVSISPTPTTRVTATPTTRVPTASPTATTKGGEQLPVAGVSYPTVFGIGLGILVIVGGVLLAL